MHYQRLSTIFFLLVTLGFCATSNGQSNKTAQAELASLQHQSTELQARQKQLQSTIKKREAQLQPLLKKSPVGKDKLDRAQKTLDKASADYRAELTLGNKSIRKNAEFKYALAQRKFRKANAERFSLEGDIEDIAAQLATLDSEASALTGRIAKQRKAVSDARSQQQAKERARLIKARNLQTHKQARREQQNQNNAAEIEHLKAQLEQLEKEKQARLASVARTKAAATSTAAQTSPVKSVPVQKTAKAEPAKDTSRTSRRVNTAAAILDNSSAVMLTTKAAVMAEKRHLQQLLNTPRARKNLYKDKILFTKSVTADGTVKRRSRPNKLRALGHHQYHGQVRLRAGEVIFLVESSSWRQDQSSEVSSGRYKVILDGRDNDNPRLVYYPAALD